MTGNQPVELHSHLGHFNMHDQNAKGYQLAHEFLKRQSEPVSVGQILEHLRDVEGLLDMESINQFTTMVADLKLLQTPESMWSLDSAEEPEVEFDSNLVIQRVVLSALQQHSSLQPCEFHINLLAQIFTVEKVEARLHVSAVLDHFRFIPAPDTGNLSIHAREEGAPEWPFHWCLNSKSVLGGAQQSSAVPVSLSPKVSPPMVDIDYRSSERIRQRVTDQIKTWPALSPYAEANKRLAKEMPNEQPDTLRRQLGFIAKQKTYRKQITVKSDGTVSAKGHLNMFFGPQR